MQVTPSKVREKRITSAIDQAEVAKELGIPRSVFVLYELGKRRLNPERQKKVEKWYGS